LRNRLRAFEAGGGIKMRALFARVQLKPTLWTFGGKVGLLLQYGSALGTARNYPPAGHLNGARAKGIVLAGRPFPLLLLGRFLFTVLVTALAIFPI